MYKISQDEKKFMAESQEEPKSTLSAVDAKRIVGATRAITGKNPLLGLAKVVAATGLGYGAQQSFSKTSGEIENQLDIPGIYEKMCGKYDTDWFDWEPETLQKTLNDHFGIEMGDEGVNALGALQTALKTNHAFEQWHIFEKVGHAFNANIVDFSSLQPLRPDEVALTCQTLEKVRPQGEYEEEVLAYMAACCLDAGVVLAAEEFFPSGVQEIIDKIGNDLDLKNRTLASWKKGLRDSKEDFPLRVQLKSLEEIQEYLEESRG
jgi:hypothetical protein